MKSSFWPMVGGISDGFANYIALVRLADAEQMSRAEFVRRLMRDHGLAENYARNVATTLLFGSGLLGERDGHCCASDVGRELIKKGSAAFLYSVFAKQFLGISDLIDIIAARQPIPADDLFCTWCEIIRKNSDMRWNAGHTRMQFKHRIEWLRSLGLVNKVADTYYLSKLGLKELTQRKVAEAGSGDAAKAASHNDIEDKLQAIGEFFEFMSIKRASVNEARPPVAPRLSENRQLDCLWARVIHFGGKVQYAFEVQLGGNISDAIERLEMVASFVQRAVVVTDEDQQKRIQDRLLVKHSPLRDKILFLSYDDIDNVVEAVNALKVFTKKVFHDG